MSRKKLGVIWASAGILAVAVAAVVGLRPPVGTAEGEDKPAPAPAAANMDAAHTQKARELLDGAVKYLLSQRDSEGGWGKGMFRPAMTALVLKALVQSPGFDAKGPVAKDAVKVILKYRHDDGGFYDQGLQNYNTSIVVTTLVALNDPQHKGAIDGAVKFLKGLQIKVGSKAPNGRVIQDSDPMRGGIGYGESSRPDLSNEGMALEAMHEAGVPADDEAMKEALIFLQHTQNRKESNPLAWAQAGDNDGGFIYAPALPEDLDKGESKSTEPAGPEGKGLRSYGSMTYVGFKSMIYAGLAKDDPRVKAAFDWIRRYWWLDRNPNLPHQQSQQGLYYYYLVFAKAMQAWGEPVITDAKGAKHNWRQELVDALAARVGKDGSWMNAADRWHEGNPVLVTAYVAAALEDVMK